VSIRGFYIAIAALMVIVETAIVYDTVMPAEALMPMVIRSASYALLVVQQYGSTDRASQSLWSVESELIDVNHCCLALVSCSVPVVVVV
jgi:hypothetical protein